MLGKVLLAVVIGLVALALSPVIWFLVSYRIIHESIELVWGDA